MSSQRAGLKALFTSEARVRILKRLILHTADRFYQSELAGLERLPVKAVQRELAKLTRFGLVRPAGRVGRRRYCRINRAHPIYPELKALLLKSALLGTRPERLTRPPLSKVTAAFVFGSVAKNEEDRRSDLDVLVIGNLSGFEWSRAIQTRRPLGFREENSIVMPEDEFRRRWAQGETFLRELVEGPKIFLIGGPDEVRRLIEESKAPAPASHGG